jgi:hypothetical protein
MRNVTHVLAGVVGMLVVILQIPGVHNVLISIIAANPDLASIVGGLAGILALYHNPKAAGK